MTSDKALIDRVRSLGASVHRAEGFRDLIDPRGTKTGGTMTIDERSRAPTGSAQLARTSTSRSSRRR